MTDLKHTKGKWHVGSSHLPEHENYQTFNIGGEDGFHVAKVSSRGAENLHNAHLIAKAPELLEETARLKADNERLRGAAETLLSACISDMGDPEEFGNDAISVGYVDNEGELKVTFKMMSDLRKALEETNEQD